MKSWQFWIGVLISVLCIGFVVSQVKDWGEFGRSFLEADYWLLIPIVASYFVIMLIRAWRWRYILNHCGHVGLGNTYMAILVCYMGNNIFPLRAGEFMRVFLIGKREPSVSYSAALATVVVERLFDFVVMLLFLAVVLLTIPFPEKYQDLESLVHNSGAGTLAGAVALFVFLFLLYARAELMTGLIGRALFFLPLKYKERILEALRKFTGGLTIMGRPTALMATLGLSLLVWVVNLIPVWLSGLAFGIHLSFTGSMFMLAVGAAAAAIPATPGFFGTFHAFNQQALVFLMGVDPAVALSFAIVLHATYYFPMVVAGALVAWRAGYSLTRLAHDAQESGDEDTKPSCK
ncbi:MAG TPA: lysylphosphatidylglycerol synthase transmembrane domain-containing protein [bacterium]|nr:lysylphosphatidylglycerol synthase transmembrane domain-containing protein [bacterium]